MVISAYYDAACADSVGALHLWDSSWRKRGWTTRLLTPQDALESPRFAAINAALGTEATREQRAPFWRWLAFEKVKTGWLSDPAVINFSFEAAAPEDYVDEPYGFSYNGVVCMDDPAILTRILNKLEHGIVGDADFAEDGREMPGLCAAYGDPGWETAPTVRFCPASAETIANCGRPL